MIEKFKPLLDFFNVIGGFSGAIVSIGIIYVWVKKPIKIFNQYNEATKISKENKDRIDKIEPILEKLVISVERHDIDTMRSAIINFANDVKNGETKTEVQYDNIRYLCKRYMDAGSNGYAKSQIEIIDKKYKEMQGLNT